MTEEKHWTQSKTIWGGILAILASLAGIYDININEMAREEMTNAILQVSAGAGALIAIYGRFTATDIIV